MKNYDYDKMLKLINRVIDHLGNGYVPNIEDLDYLKSLIIKYYKGK